MAQGPAPARCLGSMPTAVHDRIARMTVSTAVATIHTNHGDIRVDLFGHHAPKTVANFIGLADGSKPWTHPESGDAMTTPLYDGVVFHRIIKNFMLQGGDPLGKGYGGPGYEFDDEIHGELIFNKPYLLAMANAGPGTNGSQFFITTVPTPHLQGAHTIFGEVADDESKRVVDAIEAVPTGRNDVPLEPVVISSIDIVEK
jgi:peptidyl-prolyl cis-trans isomerase A (cyclophilin A)